MSPSCHWTCHSPGPACRRPTLWTLRDPSLVLVFPGLNTAPGTFVECSLHWVEGNEISKEPISHKSFPINHTRKIVRSGCLWREKVMELVKRQTCFPPLFLLMSLRCFTTYEHYFWTQSEEVPGTVHSGDFRHRGNNFTNQRNPWTWDNFWVDYPIFPSAPTEPCCSSIVPCCTACEQNDSWTCPPCLVVSPGKAATLHSSPSRPLQTSSVVLCAHVAVTCNYLIELDRPWKYGKVSNFRKKVIIILVCC